MDKNEYVSDNFNASKANKATVGNYFYDYPNYFYDNSNNYYNNYNHLNNNSNNIMFSKVDNTANDDIMNVSSNSTKTFDNDGKSNSIHSSDKQIEKYEKDLPIIAIDVIDDSFVDFFVNNGDVLLVEKSADIYQDAKILVTMNGKYSIKIFKEIESIKYLQTADKKYLPFAIAPYIEYKVIGIVIGIVHNNQEEYTEGEEYNGEEYDGDEYNDYYEDKDGLY